MIKKDEFVKIMFDDGYFDADKVALRYFIMYNLDIPNIKRHRIHICDIIGFDTQMLEFKNKNYKQLNGPLPFTDLTYTKMNYLDGEDSFILKDDDKTIILIETSKYSRDYSSESDKDFTVDFTFYFKIENSSKIENLVNKVLCYLSNKPKLNFITTKTGGGFSLIERTIENKIHTDEELEYLYPDNFNFNNLTELLNIKSSGIYMFNGNPGSGKSTLITYLICKYPSKKFVYVPSSLCSHLGDPQFISFAMKELIDSVLIIEEAESIIESRESNPNSRVNTLLNLTDGFLNNIIKSQIILTFNTKIDKIDNALLRKGRLQFHYEFTYITLDEAKKLVQFKKLNHTEDDLLTINKRNGNQGILLSDIFHYEIDDYNVNKVNKKIGF